MKTNPRPWLAAVSITLWSLGCAQGSEALRRDATVDASHLVDGTSDVSLSNTDASVSDGNVSTDTLPDTVSDLGTDVTFVPDAVASDAGPPTPSCTGSADGAPAGDGQICCAGFPIAPTPNGRCPALFHGAGTGFSPSAPFVGIAATPSGRGYWLTSANGGVFAFGDAPFNPANGSLQAIGVTPAHPVVGIATNPLGSGYWLVGADGGIYALGGAPFPPGGSVPALGHAITNAVGMAASPTGGYWVVDANGNVYACGGAAAPIVPSIPAACFDSGGHTDCGITNIVGMASTLTGQGYWLVGSDGGVYAFGDAATPTVPSIPALCFDSGGTTACGVHNIVGMAGDATGHGYWLLGSDGGVFAFGDANTDASGNFFRYTSAPVVGLAASPAVFGLWSVASDGETFVCPDAPSISNSQPPTGTTESWLGQNGAAEFTVRDASGVRNCNEVSFTPLPGTTAQVLGRYNNGCANQNWSLALFDIDWTAHTVTYDHMVFDTTAGAVAIAGGNHITTGYDASAMTFQGETWIAFECGGTIAGAATASACVGPLGASGIDASRTYVSILGNDSLGDGNLHSASVPKLLNFQGGAYLYWSAVEINAARAWVNITERGTQLGVHGGLLQCARNPVGIGAADPTYTVEVWGLGSSGTNNLVADITGVFTDGLSVYATGAIAGASCGGGGAFWPPSCYQLAIAKSANPLGLDVFSNGTLLPTNALSTDTGGYVRYFTDPSGQGYLFGSYFNNDPGVRALPVVGSANIGYLIGYPLPAGTPFFDGL